MNVLACIHKQEMLVNVSNTWYFSQKKWGWFTEYNTTVIAGMDKWNEVVFIVLLYFHRRLQI